MMPRAPHAADPEEIVARLLDVNMAGGGRNWATIPPTTPLPHETGQLLARYRQTYAGQEDAAAKARQRRGPHAEALAMAKAAKRIVKALRKGKPAPAAVAAGHARYREAGGRLDYAEWSHRIGS